MGLDWNPGNRPRPGFEAEFLWLVDGIRKQRIADESAEHSRFFEISISAFETLNAPQIGFDARANEWIVRKYHSQPREISEAEWLERFHGFYVVELVPPCDGIPRYSNGSPGGYVESFSFRAEFLRDCETALPQRLMDAAYESKFADETVAYGQELLEAAHKYAAANRVDPRDCELSDDDMERKTPRYQTNIVLSAGRWCLFWGERGHMLDAYW